MATVKIDTFGGVLPRKHPTLLPDGMAVKAHNCSLKTGKLVPLREPERVEDFIGHYEPEGSFNDVLDARSIHLWKLNSGDKHYLLFRGITWVAYGNVADDDLSRIIVSGDTEVCLTDFTGGSPLVYFYSDGKISRIPILKDRLGTPKAKRSAGQGELGDSRRYTRFFVTWVDQYGMESPVSEPSWNCNGETEIYADEDLEYNDGDSIEVTIPNGPSAFIHEDMNVDKYRLYKVVTGTEKGRIQFVKEFKRRESYSGADGVLPGETVTVKIKDEDAGEVLAEIEAPIGDLRCIQAVPGNFYCGISPTMPKTVFFSDVDLLYSWPIAYRYDVKDNVVALAVTGNTVFALTDGTPYVLTGTLPESMTVTKLGGAAACVSRRGVCVHQNVVYFVSNYGLMAIASTADEGTCCKNLTEKVFTREQWIDFNPSSCVMGVHDGALHLFFDLLDGSNRGLRIDLLESGETAVTTHDEVAKCVVVDDATGVMYFLREADN